MKTTISRRSFLVSSGGLLGGAWLSAHWPTIAAAAEHARQAAAAAMPPAFEFLRAAEAADVDAIAAQIIPSGGDGPGAREARVVHFIDRALTTFMRGAVDDFRRGLEAHNAACHERYADVERFAELDTARALEFLQTNEATPFFQQLRFLTVLGMFALPAYGGNHQRLGWRLLGFEDRHVFSPPFGDYDRDYPGFAPVPEEPA